VKVVKAKGGRNERLIVTALITNRAVLGAVAAQWNGKLFQSRWANIVAGWCVKHYEKFRKPPGTKIQSLFERWADAHSKDKDTVGLVGAFLSDLSGAYASRKKEVDPEYTIDLAKEFFERVRLDTLKEEIGGLLDEGDVKEAWRRVENLKRVDLGLGGAFNPLKDMEAVRRAFEEVSEPLITYPGALGEFFGDSLERQGFIAFFGREKIGKSTVLFDVAYRALQQGRKVAIFQLGDLSQGQTIRRIYARLCRRPFKATKPGQVVKVPNYLAPPSTPDGLPDIRHDEKRWDGPLDFKLGEKKAKKMFKKLGDTWRLSCHAARTLSVPAVESTLDNWERTQGFKPDVIVFDYAELFAANGKDAYDREAINANWIGMSSIRLSRHCLVVTASQTNADSYEAELLSMKNFSEDKRKHSHVTGTVGLNQTDDEKAAGVYRLQWLTGRDWEYSTSKVVYTAGCAAIQHPFMFSTF
jgi:hypothetical protein